MQTDGFSGFRVSECWERKSSDVGWDSHEPQDYAIDTQLHVSDRFFINTPHAVRNDVVDFLAIVPSPPQLILQLYTVSTGGERSCSF